MISRCGAVFLTGEGGTERGGHEEAHQRVSQAREGLEAAGSGEAEVEAEAEACGDVTRPRRASFLRRASTVECGRILRFSLCCHAWSKWSETGGRREARRRVRRACGEGGDGVTVARGKG